MRDILRKAKPQRLDDLIALNALYRPGPLRSGMVDDFIARKHGRVKVSYEVKELEPILADTYGVIAYQEQVMRIAQRRWPGSRWGRPTCCARRWARRKPTSCRRSAKKFVDGREGARHQREEGREDLRPDGALRRIRLQQVALDRVRAAGVSDGVSEGELPVALRRGAADDRSAEHRQARDVSAGVPRSRHSGAAARHQQEPAGVHRDARGRALRPDGGEERRRGRDRVDSRRARGAGEDHVAARALRRARSAPGQQARAREPGEGRCLRLASPQARKRRSESCAPA